MSTGYVQHLYYAVLVSSWQRVTRVCPTFCLRFADFAGYYIVFTFRSDRGRFSRLLFFSSLSLLLFVFFGCSDGMEREACVCDHGYERSDLCAEIIVIIIINIKSHLSEPRVN